MNKKKWFLLVLTGLLTFGYIKLFYKTYSNDAVPQSADRIAVIDVKRVINTLIWNFITTPSQWTSGKKSKPAEDKINWRDIIELPDYAFAFHAAGQPESAWYMLLNVKSEAAFEEAAKSLDLVRLNEHEYAAKTIWVYKQGKKILVGNAGVDTAYLHQTVNELLIKKSYSPKETLAKAVNADSHLAIYIAPNSFLEKNAIVTANFDKRSIMIEGDFIPKKEYQFSEAEFNFSSQTIFAAGFTQPTPKVAGNISEKDRTNTSKALGIDVDSFFISPNKSYSLYFEGIKNRVDSAVTYEYDDDFNKVEKVTVNNVEEPSFIFSVNGDSVNKIQGYLKRSGKLERTGHGNLFLPFPFVRSYCSMASGGQLNIAADNYKQAQGDKKERAIFFLQLILSKMPPAYLKYLSDDWQQAISNLESVSLLAKKDGEKIVLKGKIQKKKNDRAIIRL